METKTNNKPSRTRARLRVRRGQGAPKAAPLPSGIQINTILLPTDFSAPCQVAIHYGEAFARLFGARLVLLHVVEPISSTADFGYGPVVRLQPDPISIRRSERHLHAIERRQLDCECPCETLVRSGVASEEIAKATKELKVDLIILATHDHAGVREALPESTAARVIRRSACPVLVVHEKRPEFVFQPAIARSHYENQTCN